MPFMSFMPFDSAWAQTISAISALVIGGSAVVIAYLNLKTSSQKLQFDMFEPRYEIYKFTLNYLTERIRGGKSPKSEELNDLIDKIDLSKWFFDNEIVSFLDEIKIKSIEQPVIEADIAAQLGNEANGAVSPSPKLEAIEGKLQQIAVDFQTMRATAVKSKFNKYTLPVR